MRWISQYPGSMWSLTLVTLAAVTLLISGVTLLIGYFQRQRSAPSREVILRMGLCLVAVWPLLLAVGIVTQSMSADSDSSQPLAHIATPPAAESPPEPLVDRTDPVPFRDTLLPLVEPSQVTTPEIPSTPNSETSLVATELPVADRVEESELYTPSLASQVAEPQTVFDPLPVTALPVELPKTNPKSNEVVTTPVTTQPVWQPIPAEPRRLAVYFATVWPWLCVVWGMGTWIAGLTLIRDLLRLRRRRRQLRPYVNEEIAAILAQAMQVTGLLRRPDVFLSTQIGSPCTSGVRRPILILPQSMLDQNEYDSATLLGIFTHECAHIVRRDVAWSLLARVVQSVYWWEPGLRRMVRQLSYLREEICDNHVLSSSVDPRVYAKVLVDFAEGPLFRPVVGVIGMVGTDNPLVDRVERLLQEAPDISTGVKWRSKWGVATIVVLICGMIGVIGACAEISKSLSQAMFEEQKTVTSFDMNEPPRVPIRSGESAERPAESAAMAQVEGEAPVEGADYLKFGPPTEAGSGVSSPDGQFSPFRQPAEAGSGTSPPAFPSDEELVADAPPYNPEAPLPVLGFPKPFERTSLPQATTYKSVTRTIIVDGKQTTHTYMVPVYGPLNPTSDVIQDVSGLVPPSEDCEAPPPQQVSLTLTLPSAPAFSQNEQVTLVATLPAGKKLLPKQILFEGLIVLVPTPEPSHIPGELESPTTPPSAEPPPTPITPADTPPSGEPAATDNPAPEVAPAVADPAAAAAEAVASANAAAAALVTPQTSEVTLSGPSAAIAAWRLLESQGATAVLTKAVTPTPEAAKDTPLVQVHHLCGKSSFQIEIAALADDQGQFRAISCWGRELASTNPDKGLGELAALLTRYKAECLRVANEGKAVPSVFMDTGAPMFDPRTFDGRRQGYAWVEEPGHEPAAEVLLLLVGIQVFDDMRYGDVQSIVKVCTDLKLLPRVMNDGADCSNCVLSPRVFAPVELTMVYDKQGQRVGQDAVLLAEKAGATGVQVLTEGQIDTLLATFVNRHSPHVPTLILTDDPDLPLESLIHFIVRANRAGITVVRRSQLEELRLRGNDRLVPLLNDAPQEQVAPRTRLYSGEEPSGLVEPEPTPVREDPSASTRPNRTTPHLAPVLNEPGVREI